MEMKKLLILFVVVGLLVGCSGVPLNQVPSGSYVYQQGYQDGYKSGEASEGYVYSRFTKNHDLYKMNSEYRNGWEDGFRMGSGKMRNINNYFK